MKVKEVMTPQLKGIRTDNSLQDAAEHMRILDVGSLPVVSPDDNVVKGIITDRDIVVRSVARGHDASSQTVGDVMSSPIVCCHEEDSVERASAAMKSRQVRRVMVLNEKDQPVGMVTLGDLAKGPIDHDELTTVMRYVSTPAAAQ